MLVIPLNTTLGGFLSSFLFPDVIGNDINTTTTSVMLTATTISQCFNVYLENDALVEGTETVTLSLKLMESDMNFGIRDIAPNTTNIIITDDDCELLLCTYMYMHIHTYSSVLCTCTAILLYCIISALFSLYIHTKLL